MLGLRTTVYTFEDLGAAKTWYSQAFGVKPYFDEPYYVGFNIRGFELGLMPEFESTAKGSNVIAYWGVEKIELEYNRLTKFGATANTPITEVGGGIKLGTVKDPFGNVLGLIYNPLFKVK
ncbi:glyoxalase/bleomycin resistance/extradiol dioxygenase family protein [Thalassomonas viridans]|uniref:Glyoxalase/bleomycin resistance/extradiol dioxygenase family protein n=2 Tax=Thalassomonas viridans TaxID=137584 RepID=A0AAF0CDL7_9GAMM|nr:glyoxalase/bleomycin resistance/extradiol dioxygenase family protein [Thalassomonas viridans]